MLRRLRRTGDSYLDEAIKDFARDDVCLWESAVARAGVVGRGGEGGEGGGGKGGCDGAEDGGNEGHECEEGQGLLDHLCRCWCEEGRYTWGLGQCIV